MKRIAVLAAITVLSGFFYLAIGILSIGLGLDPMSQFDWSNPGEGSFLSWSDTYGSAMLSLDWFLYIPLVALIIAAISWALKIQPSLLLGLASSLLVVLLRPRGLVEGAIIIGAFTLIQWFAARWLSSQWPRRPAGSQ